MDLVSVLESRKGTRTSVFVENGDLESGIRGGWVDACIVPCRDRLSPLGANRGFLSHATGIPGDELEHLVRRNCLKSGEVTLVGIPSRNPSSPLRGLVLCPSASSDCYRNYAKPFVSHPSRDFYYRVTYEAIAYAVEALGAKRLALASSIEFDQDIAAYAAEALVRYRDSSLGALDSFTFLEAGSARDMRKALKHLDPDDETGTDGAITRLRRSFPGHAEIHLHFAGRASAPELAQAVPA